MRGGCASARPEGGASPWQPTRSLPLVARAARRPHQCDLCPRDCKLHEGQRGFCFVRQRVGDQMVLTTYGRSSGFCVDPIEKKPLNHFYPGTQRALVRHRGLQPGLPLLPELGHLQGARVGQAGGPGLARGHRRSAPRQLGCKSVAFTYNDPVIFAEYAMDVADACHARGMQTVAVTAGYMHAEPRREFYAKMDAANVDLKAFTEDFYHRITFAQLQPVLETLEYLVHETKVWLEITTLLIPGHNDSRSRGGEALRVGARAARARTCRCTSRPSIRTSR